MVVSGSLEMAGEDHLLREVMETLSYLSLLLHKLEGAGKLTGPSLVIHRRLQAVLMRAKEEVKDFEGFFCLRLVLDQHSPLASFFIDFFSHLHFLLVQLYYSDHLAADISSVLRRSLEFLLQPVISTCRLLYATCKMLPISCAPHVAGQILDEECKREGRRHGRQFSSNLFLSRARLMACVYLDQPGCSRVNLVQKLGTGISADVYKGAFETPLDCGHLDTGCFVAVKMFKDHSRSALGSNFGSNLFQSMQQLTSGHDYGGTHKFLAELDKLVVAKHPNIVTAMGYIGKRPQGECGFVMELMDESLFDYLEKVKDGSISSLKEVDMLDLMLEIARGMRFLHECQLIHLDLKPKNVLLRFTHGKDHPPVVKIADLGITTLSALFQEEMKCEHMDPLGTPCYMAPEIRDPSSHKVHYDDKVDVFSYGTTCFNILTGNPDACAFSKSTLHFYKAIKTGCWKQWVQGCNPFLVKLIGRCWEMDPRLRPTFATLCILLQHVIQSLLAPVFMYSATEWLNSFFMTRPRLKKLKDDKKLDLKIYGSILHYYYSSKFVDLEEIKTCVLRFESHVGANADLLPTDKSLLSRIERLLEKAEQLGVDDDGVDNGDDGDDDIAMDGSILERALVLLCTWCGKGIPKPAQRGSGSSLRSQDNRSLIMRSKEVDFRKVLVESCVNDADPLLCIKAEACLTLLGLYFPDDSSIINVGELGWAIQWKRAAVNFSADEARVPLQVDTSLLPLLVAFWQHPDTFRRELAGLNFAPERQFVMTDLFSS